MQRVADRLRDAGLRVTAPRVAILEALESRRTHPSAEEVFADLRHRHPSLSLSTVYKTLEAFLEAGLVRRINSDGSLRVDGITRLHDHALCRSCGAIYDIDRRHFPVPAPPAKLPPGLEVQGIRIEFDVICAACRGSEKKN